MTIIYFILILGTTVFVHELGHFLFAKKYGVHVYEFSIGMGPRLFKFNRKNDETDYCLRLFPIGGFVQMAGEEIDDDDDDIPEDKKLTSKPAFQRFMIMIAGVMMNFITAFILLFFIGLFNTVSLNNVYINGSTIDGLNNDDKIVAINGNFVNNYDKLALEMTIAGSENFTMTLKNSEGKKYDIEVNPVEVGDSFLPYGKDYGFEVSNLEITKSDIKGLNVGDTITKVNGQEIKDLETLLVILEDIEDEFELTIIDSKEEEKDFTIEVKEKEDDTSLGFSYGFYLKGEEQKGLIAGIKYAFLKFFSTVEQMVFTVFYLMTGKISLSMMSGPVGIFNVVGTVSKAGFTSVISLLCLICINVGFINILPFPAFDGGHVVFILIEKIKGSRVDPKVENTIHSIGFILLMILMVLITYNDIIKLF